MLMAIKEVLRGQELPPGIARFIAEPFNVVTWWLPFSRNGVGGGSGYGTSECYRCNK